MRGLKQKYYNLKNYLRDTYYDVRWYFKNIITYRKTLSEYRPWDQFHLIKLLIDFLDRSASEMDKRSQLLYKDKYVEDMKICVEHLKKYVHLEENLYGYVTTGEYRFEPIEETLEGMSLYQMVTVEEPEYVWYANTSKARQNKEEALKKYHLGRAFTLMNKKLRKWWW